MDDISGLAIIWDWCYGFFHCFVVPTPILCHHNIGLNVLRRTLQDFPVSAVHPWWKFTVKWLENILFGRWNCNKHGQWGFCSWDQVFEATFHWNSGWPIYPIRAGDIIGEDTTKPGMSICVGIDRPPFQGPPQSPLSCPWTSPWAPHSQTEQLDP